MSKPGLIFPHQLFDDHPILTECTCIYIIEEYLFFNQYAFHKQKLAFHRASMRSFEQKLKSRKIKVQYISSTAPLSDIRAFIKSISETDKPETIYYIDPTDHWLEQRIKNTSKQFNIKLKPYENPLFLNSKQDLSSFFRADKNSFFQTTFYKQQRKRLNVLLDEEEKPVGGKWTFDKENRKKFPKGKLAPAVSFPASNPIWEEAVKYVNENYKDNPGDLSNLFYPFNHKDAVLWLQQFLEYRFFYFGDYEDAIVKEELILHHSLLSPLINTGLLTPQFVLQQSLDFAKKNNIPINSTEGFIRQIIGWREFIRGIYECKGVESRTTNYWGFKRKIPGSFYDGTTGIEPIDQTIKKILKTGYCHHIERLMILGNFMLLCEFDPDEVYKWFMEMFIDAYDWVMVPNVYGMSQFADGGTFATKPYISGSNYIIKMSNYKKEKWQQIWDALFWNFIDKHQEFFRKNPRTSMMYYSLNRMNEEKRKGHLKLAKEFLSSL